MKKLLPSSPKSYLALTSTLSAAKGAVGSGMGHRVCTGHGCSQQEHQPSAFSHLQPKFSPQHERHTKSPVQKSTMLAAITGYFTARTEGFGCLLLKPSFVSVPCSCSSELPVGGVTQYTQVSDFSVKPGFWWYHSSAKMQLRSAGLSP